MEEKWSVEVSVNGKRILIIANDWMSGSDNIDNYSEEVRHCANQLLAFIGRDSTETFFITEPE